MVYSLSTAVRDEISLIVPRFWGNDARIDLELLANHYNAEILYVKFKDPELLGAVQKLKDSMEYNYRIAISQDISANRIRFTLAHEIGHIISDKLHSKSSESFKEQALIKDTTQVLFRGGESSPVEQEANEIAANLLMPAFIISQYKVKGQLTNEELSAVLGVSNQALNIRCNNLGL